MATYSGDGPKWLDLHSRRHRTTWASFRTSTSDTNARDSILGNSGRQDGTPNFRLASDTESSEFPGQRHTMRLIIELTQAYNVLQSLNDGGGRKAKKSVLATTITKIRTGDHYYKQRDEDLIPRQPRGPGRSRPHTPQSDDSDDSFKVRRESGHTFNFRLKKLQSIEQAPTQTGPEVPSSTSGVMKWAILRLKKDELFQESEFRVQRSRYKSSLSALQYSLADLEREEPHIPSSDSQPLLLQWK